MPFQKCAETCRWPLKRKSALFCEAPRAHLLWEKKRRRSGLVQGGRSSHLFTVCWVQTVSGPTADAFLLKALEFLPTLPPAAAVAAVVLLLRPYLSNWTGIVGSLFVRPRIGVLSVKRHTRRRLSFPVNKFGVDLCCLLSCFWGSDLFLCSLILVLVRKKTLCSYLTPNKKHVCARARVLLRIKFHPPSSSNQFWFLALLVSQELHFSSHFPVLW